MSWTSLTAPMQANTSLSHRGIETEQYARLPFDSKERMQLMDACGWGHALFVDRFSLWAAPASDALEPKLGHDALRYSSAARRSATSYASVVNHGSQSLQHQSIETRQSFLACRSERLLSHSLPSGPQIRTSTASSDSDS
ncbi:unnamed protein product, partial [Mycena citricolor]